MYPDAGALRERIARYFLPFHRSIAELLDLPGVMGLLDCHSMDRVGPRRAPDAGRGRKDIVLGNNGDERGDEAGERGLLTCPRGLLEGAKAAFEEEGFSVSLNDPYAGGFITATYGRRLVRERKVAIQVELNQALYVDFPGRSLLPRSVEAVRDRVSRALGKLAGLME
jgi:N-formylglutamate amidohydrolase